MKTESINERTSLVEEFINTADELSMLTKEEVQEVLMHMSVDALKQNDNKRAMDLLKLKLAYDGAPVKPEEAAA